MYTFLVTNMDMEPYQIIQFYCGRGKMENFIKEMKSGFDFATVSNRSKVVNANRMRLHMLAYNLFNWFRRLAFPANMRKQQVDTIRLKLMKIAARVICSAIYITFKLWSSCPYKKEFYKTLENIRLFVRRTGTKFSNSGHFYLLMNNSGLLSSFASCTLFNCHNNCCHQH